MQSVNSVEILGDIIHYMKYARYLPDKQRRETYPETVSRNMGMHIQRFPSLETEIRENYEYVYDKKVLPSLRSMQFAGKAIEANHTRMFNCSYAPINDYHAFSEAFFLLLSGSGFGFSVQRHHVRELPEIRKPKKPRKYMVNDSIEGWADAVKILMKSYFTGSYIPIYDFSQIRPRSSLLVTSGGKAPGPEPLRVCLEKIQELLNMKADGDKLTPIECHDVLCIIADAVLSGGIRRASLISLFSIDDEDMLNCKSYLDVELKNYIGYNSQFKSHEIEIAHHHLVKTIFLSETEYESFIQCGKIAWYYLYPERARSNNSMVVHRNLITQSVFKEKWDVIKNSGSGEPAFWLTNDVEYGVNPCNEASLRPNTFCNLCTINASTIESQEDFENRVRVAAFIGTLQASYTDFHYLRYVWKEHTEKDALLGISLTGIASNRLVGLDIEKASRVSLVENERVAKIIGIHTAARLNLIKPEGTGSLVLGTSSGIHAWHCLQRQTKILMANGKWEEVGTLVKKKSIEEVICYDERTQEFTKSPIEGWHCNKFPTAEWYKIVTKYHTGSGRFTPEHRVLTECGWKEVSTLTSEDKIASQEPNLTDIELQVILGSLLGDGSLRKKTRANLRIGHCKQQQDYLFWKSNLLKRLGARIVQVTDNFIAVDTKSSKVLASLYDEIYENAKRSIKKDWIEKLSPLGITIWYLDDGGISIKRKNGNDRKKDSWAMRISTQSFPENQIKILQEWLLGTYSISTKTIENRGLVLTFDRANAIKFFHLIENYVPLSMEYKLPPEFRGRFLEVKPVPPIGIYYEPIISVQRANVSKTSGSYKTAYCIDVKDTHNFITQSGVTHNSKYYIRRLRVNKNEPIYPYLKEKLPNLIEDEIIGSGAIISIPMKAPDGATTREYESPLDLLERVKLFHQLWIKPTHRRGMNGHNVSVTISVKENEWDTVGEWLWENRNDWNGISFLPYDGGNYKQTPFEEFTEERYNEMVGYLAQIDLSEIIEEEDNSEIQKVIACAGNACEVL